MRFKKRDQESDLLTSLVCISNLAFQALPLLAVLCGHNSSQSKAHSILLSNVTRLRSVVTPNVVKVQCCYATLLHRRLLRATLLTWESNGEPSPLASHTSSLNNRPLSQETNDTTCCLLLTKLKQTKIHN